jgi:hypothetical protein
MVRECRGAAFPQAAQGQREPESVVSRRFEPEAAADEEEAVIAIKVARSDTDDGFDDHVPQQMQPEAAQVMLGQGSACFDSPRRLFARNAAS